MAITIGNLYPVSAGGYYPAYNDMVITASSTSTGQPNFKYVVDVYVTGTQVARMKYSPDANGYLTANVQRIVENYVASDISTSDNGFKQCPNSIVQVQIKVGEEYGTTPVVYPNLGTKTVYAINTCVDWDERLSWDDSQYLLDVNTAAFLTSQSAFDIQAGQNAWVHMVRDTTNKPAKMRVQTFNGGGGLIAEYRVANTYATVSSTNDRFLRFPSGTGNLATIPSGSITVVTGALPIITGSVASYSLTPLDNSNNPVGAGITYNVKDANCRYTNYRLHFMNKYGGFDSANFSLISRKTITIDRKKYRRTYGSNASNVWGYNQSDTLEAVYDVQAQVKVKLNSDWLTEAQSSWLEELLTSPKIYWDKDGTNLQQVSLSDTAYEPKKKVQDKLIQLSIEINLGFIKKRQRG